ncbi:uncharacterized protein LOC113339337 [Papaver somniferum]|uniref:uncharacterized protein LOC113339337 n=1 Tax=Papaver somniferum TaxID=3469 RepID=UPI000E6FB35C|nr:uncharacterized protein LOC113339337 [Papaver somniferum]
MILVRTTGGDAKGKLAGLVSSPPYSPSDQILGLQTNGEKQSKFLVHFMVNHPKSMFQDVTIVADFSGIELLVTFCHIRIAANSATKYTSQPSIDTHAGSIERWNAQIGNFEIKYEILSSPKSQVIAYFLAEFPLKEDESVEEMMDIDEECGNPTDLLIDNTRWEILVDGSSNGDDSGIGIVFISPAGTRLAYSFRLEFASTNNETEHEAVVHTLRLSIEMKLEYARITSDSQLVIRQIEGVYRTNEPSFQKYKKLVGELSAQIPKINWRHISRKDNRLAYAFAFIPSMMVDPTARDIKIQTLFLPSINKEKCEDVDVMLVDNEEDEKANKAADWRTQLHLYLEKGEVPRNRLEAHKLKSRETNYELRDGVLYRRSFLGPSLRCLTRTEGMEILKALHYGDAGNHSGGRSLAYREKIHGYYWPYMHEDVKEVSRRCEECQRHGNKIHVPGAMLKSSTSEWPFGKWGFRIPTQLVSDNGKQFEGENIELLLNAFKIQSGKSTPLSPRSNGQAEATNKTIADTLKKKLERHNKGWCEKVHNAVWAYRTTRREATRMSPFCLTYGVEAVFPTKVIIPTTKREAWEKNLSVDLILTKLDDLEERREVSLRHMENYHQRIAREYNKRVKIRDFHPGKLVLREIPPYQRRIDGMLEKR